MSLTYILSIVLVASLSVWKCVSNMVLLLCFVRNRRQFATFALNISILTVNALLQGVIGLFAAVTGLVAMIQGVRPRTCSVAVALILASITCETLQTLYVFIQRCFTFCSLRYHHSQRSIILIHTMLFLISLVLIVTPFSIWTVDNANTSVVKTCNAGIFKNPLESLGYFAYVTGVPGIVSVLIYVILQIKLKRDLRKIFPDISMNDNTNTLRASNCASNCAPNGRQENHEVSSAKLRRYNTLQKALKTLAFFLVTNTSLPVQYLMIWAAYYSHPRVSALVYIHAFSFVLLYFNTSLNIIVIIHRYKVVKESVMKMLADWKMCIFHCTTNTNEP